jgi:hypothetical protein
MSVGFMTTCSDGQDRLWQYRATKALGDSTLQPLASSRQANVQRPVVTDLYFELLIMSMSAQIQRAEPPDDENTKPCLQSGNTSYESADIMHKATIHILCF